MSDIMHRIQTSYELCNDPPYENVYQYEIRGVTKTGVTFTFWFPVPTTYSFVPTELVMGTWAMMKSLAEEGGNIAQATGLPQFFPIVPAEMTLYRRIMTPGELRLQ